MILMLLQLSQHLKKEITMKEMARPMSRLITKNFNTEMHPSKAKHGLEDHLMSLRLNMFLDIKDISHRSRARIYMVKGTPKLQQKQLMVTINKASTIQLKKDLQLRPKLNSTRTIIENSMMKLIQPK